MKLYKIKHSGLKGLPGKINAEATTWSGTDNVDKGCTKIEHLWNTCIDGIEQVTNLNNHPFLTEGIFKCCLQS